MRTVINGQDVYLDGDNIPEFSYSLNELTDFTKVKGSSSTTFDIPASNGARVGLGGVAMQEQPIGEVPIRIGEGGQVLFEGVCVPTEWTDESIKVVAYGDNATWFDRAKSTKCKDVDLGFNYRPGDNITQDELELAVSTQLFNERLLFSSNVGVQYGGQNGTAGTGNSNSNLLGDFQLEYLLTRDGKIRLKAYSVSNDRNLNRADQAPTTQGVGVVYSREGDTFWDLFRKRQRTGLPQP